MCQHDFLTDFRARQRERARRRAALQPHVVSIVSSPLYRLQGDVQATDFEIPVD